MLFRSRRCEVTLRIRFDETTTAPWRPKQATLAPEARAFLLMDASGRVYAPVQIDGGPVAAGEATLLEPLKPGDAHQVRLAYDVPATARELRLLVRDTAWDYAFTIAHENSLFHRKIWLGIAP